MGLIDTLRYKYTVYKLEQKYTRREKRTTFISHAQYVDGEYVYTSPPESTKSGASASTSYRRSGADWLPASKHQSFIVKAQEVVKRRSQVF